MPFGGPVMWSVEALEKLPRRVWCEYLSGAQAAIHWQTEGFKELSGLSRGISSAVWYG
jgi:hypothetical protein